MSEVIKFSTPEQMFQYVEMLTSRAGYIRGDEAQQVAWRDMYNTILQKHCRVASHYYKANGDIVYTYEYNPEIIRDWEVPDWLEGIEEGGINAGLEPISVSSSSSSSASTVGTNVSSGTATSTVTSNTVGGGGVKTPPTVTKVVTNNTTATATAGETAKGLKDVGVATKAPVQSILTGVMAAYGLYSLAITVSNWQTWRDAFNYIFPGALDENATFDDVVDFAKTKFNFYIGNITGDNKSAQAMVPEQLVSRIYDFLSTHMEADGTIDGLQPDMMGDGFNLLSWERAAADDRFYKFNAGPLPSPAADDIYCSHVYWEENLTKNWVADAIAQYIGLGYLISQSTTNAILNGVAQLAEHIVDNCPHEVLVRKYVYSDIMLTRANRSIKSAPVSPNEIKITIWFLDDHDMVIDGETGWVTLETLSNSSDPCRFLKYGSSGEDLYDYAYWVRSIHSYTSGTLLNIYKLELTFPAGDPLITDYGDSTYGTSGNPLLYYLNGYATGGKVYNKVNVYPPSQLTETENYILRYSNLGYKGDLINYKPDEYLSAIVGKDDNPDTGGTKLRPAPTGTGYLAWDDRYKQWASRTQNNGSIDKDGNNSISGDVPVVVPFGSTNGETIINHGYNNPTDPKSYKNTGNQDDRQRGNIPSDTPIDDINEGIQDAVEDYNKSRTTPDSLPDPVPAPEPLPLFPDTPPQEPSGDSGDTPDPGLIPGVEASGMVSVYNPTKAQVISFSAWLWTDSIIENLKKILTNPIDAIIGLHIMYATPETGSAANIICGYLDSGVSAKVVTKQYIEVDCGSKFVPEFYGDVRDYEPYTKVNLYLPFIGIVTLKANDVVGKTVKIKYGVDVLTGTCLAMVNVITDNSDIQCYTFAGNCAVQIPLTGGNYADVIRSIASMTVGVVGSVATANPVPLVGGILGGAMSASLDVSRSGSLGANAGVMGVRKPYIIITRTRAYDANSYSQFYGYPANMTINLGSCKGYTRVKSVHIDSMGIATDTEVTEIESLLKQGVIIK